VCSTFDGDLADYAQWLKLTRQQEMAVKTPKQEKAANKTIEATPAKIIPVKETVATPIVEKSTATSKPIDKELARKEAAAKREQTRPLRSKIEKAEKEVKDHQAKLKQLEQTMADSGLYEASRKAELLKLMEQQQQSLAAIVQLDESLLEMMMQLDELESA
jgi:ATP-binding cassette subfamily F protein 3